MTNKIKTAHVIWKLDIGGAELSLLNLVEQMDRNVFVPEIILMKDGGPLEKKICELGITLSALGSRRNLYFIRALYRYILKIKEIKPDIIQSWMLSANLIVTLLNAIARLRIPVIWNIRHYQIDELKGKFSLDLTEFFCAKLSHTKWAPSKIIFNSQASLKVHAMLGYNIKKLVCIPNGFDTKAFMANPSASNRIREQLGIPANTLLIGLTARYHPCKDHETFVSAAGLLVQRYNNVQFLLCGQGITTNNKILMKQIHNAGISSRCHLLGLRHDIQDILAALDVATCSSYNDAFPRMIGEAMACEIPCVVTDTGDTAYLVGDTGIVVPVRNPQELCQGWMKIIEMPDYKRKAMGSSARKRIINEFNQDNIAVLYQNLYKDVVNGLDRHHS